MPKLLNNKIIDLSKINTNEILDFSFNFELLKYVITSLINNQNNMDIQINDLKLSLIKQQKYSSELESAILQLKIEKEENAEILEKLMEKKNELLNIQMKLKNQEENIIEYTGELISNIENIQKRRLNTEKEKEKEEEFIENKESAQKEEENKEQIINENIKENIGDNLKENMEENIKENAAEKKIKENIEENIIENNIDINEDKDKKKNLEEEKNIQKEEEKNINEMEKMEKNIIEVENINNENIIINEGKEDNINKEKEIFIKKEEEDNNKEEKKVKEEKREEKNIIIPSISNEIASINNKHEDIHKQLQLIVGELKNIKLKNNTLEKDLFSFKTNMTNQLKEKLETNIPSLLDNTFEKKSAVIQKKIKIEIDKVNDNINNLNKEFIEKLSKSNEKISKEMTSKEEKKNLEIDQIKKTLDLFKKNFSAIDEKLLNMITNMAFNNFKKELEEKNDKDKKIINIEILNVKSNLKNVKEQLTDHLYDKKDHDNLTNLIKIVESISNDIQILTDFKKGVEEKEKRKAIVDATKYVKQDGFNEAINNINKNIDNNRKEFSEIHMDIDNIRTKDLHIKANLRDLKNLEDSIFSKMETLKETIKNNFVEKTMLVKNLKYLELQTKELIEENQKKTDRRENWLLTKRPVNSHLCASCESYIGDLKPNSNTKYIAWNKYPKKEHIEKIFRINAGFSKVLQMVNNNESKNEKKIISSLNDSKEEKINSSADEDKNKSKKFEKIHNYRKGKSRIRISKNLYKSRTCSQIDDYDYSGTLPKISRQKSINFNAFSEETRKMNNSNLKSRSRSLISDDEIIITKNENKDNKNNDKESEKPIITKVYRKFGENQEKKEDENKK